MFKGVEVHNGWAVVSESDSRTVSAAGITAFVVDKDNKGLQIGKKADKSDSKNIMFIQFSCQFHLIGGQVGHPRLLHLWAGARGLPCAKGGRARWGAEGGGWCPWAPWAWLWVMWVMYSTCWNLEAMQLMQLQSYSFIFGGFHNPDYGNRTCMFSIRSSKHFVIFGCNSAGGTGLQNCDWAAERRSYWNRRTNGRPGARCIRLCDALYGDQVGGIVCMIGQDSRLKRMQSISNVKISENINKSCNVLFCDTFLLMFALLAWSRKQFGQSIADFQGMQQLAV